MNPSMTTVGIILKAFDQTSSGFRSAVSKMESLRQKSEQLSRGMLANGLIAGGALMKTVSAFSELEDASTRLKVTMMGAGGAVSGQFEQINGLAVKLGNELPGTSADFLNMMAKLKQFGITDESILGGVGDAAARIGVLLKMAPEASAEFVAKMKKATGTADKDMLGLMDTIQRVFHTGVDPTEMMYAFARSAGALKQLKMQGLEATKALAPAYSMLIQTGFSGETVGSGMSSAFLSTMDKKKVGGANKQLAGTGIKLNFTDKKGNFLGIENTIMELEKLNKLNPLKKQSVLKDLFGGGQDQSMMATLMTEGIEGYRKQIKAMEAQADLQARVAKQLGTLKNLWDAAAGTFTNALAAFGETISPELEAMTKWFGELSKGVIDFTKAHPTMVKYLGLAVVGFVAASLGLGVLGLAFAGVIRYVALIGPVLSGLLRVATLLGPVLRFAGTAALFLGRALMLNPIGFIITAIAAAAFLIYKYWTPIKGFFKGLWDGVASAFTSAWKIIKEGIASVTGWMPDWMKNLIPGTGSSHQPNAPAAKMGPAAKTATGPRRQDVGGNLNIKIDSEGRPRVTSVQSNNPAVNFNVDAGMTMAY